MIAGLAEPRIGAKQPLYVPGQPRACLVGSGNKASIASSPSPFPAFQCCMLKSGPGGLGGPGLVCEVMCGVS